jgi:hypothetical protein
MRELTSYMYRIQEEIGTIEGGGTQYNNQRGFNLGGQGGFCRGLGRGSFGRGGRGPIIYYNCLGHLARDYLNPCKTYTYCRELDHAT